MHKTHKNSPDQKRTSAPRLKKLNPSTATSEAHLWEGKLRRYWQGKISQISTAILNLYRTFIKAASLLPPLLSYKPGGTGMWQPARYSAGLCFFVFFSTGLGLCSQLTCEEATADSLTLKNFWSNEDDSTFTEEAYVNSIIHLKQKVRHSVHPVERVIVKRDPFQHLPFYHFLSKFMWCEDGHYR